MSADDTIDYSYRFANFQLLPWRRLLRGDDTVPLRPRAVSILTALVRHHGRVVLKDEIIAEVWPDTYVGDNNLATHVGVLRKVLGRDAIATVPGLGYRFAMDVERMAAPRPTPPAPEPSRPQNNLSCRPAVIGRDFELAELMENIGSNRLVTLVGPSGIGKTWLAVEIGWRLIEHFPDGVWRINLAPLTNPAVVTSATAQVLGVPLLGGEAPVDVIAAAIDKQRQLLIFDSCEHVIGAAASLIGALLARVPGLSILATSQEALRLPDEQLYRLNPLALPPLSTEREGSAGKISGFGAVALFVARAHAADRRFALNDANAAALAEICRRLDGIPLALEMAAARLPLLGIERLRAGLDERLDILNNGTRTGDTRHRTLRGMVEWSYGLLDAAEQRLFRRLAVFAGSFSLDAAIAVAGEDEVERWETADTLGLLIDKSLVTVESGEPPRYRVLETLRIYAAEKLEASGEHETAAERHARHFTALFERAEEEWETTPDPEWLHTYGPEIHNVRSALDWALAEPRRTHIAIALAGATARLWERCALLGEGRRYADCLVEMIDEQTPRQTAARLLRYSAILWRDADRLRALALHERSAILYRELGDLPKLGSVIAAIGSTYSFLGRKAEAKSALNEARDILSASNRAKSLYNVMNELAILAMITNETDNARQYCAVALYSARQLKDPLRENITLGNLAEVECRVGAIDRAIIRAEQATKGLRTAQQPSYLGCSLVNLASYRILAGDHSQARTDAEEALALVRDQGGHWLRLCLERWALLGAIDGRHAAAAQLIGFIDAEYVRCGEVRHPTEQQMYDRLLTLLRAELSADDIQVWADEGALWDERRAINFTVEHLIDPAGSEIG
jgi:predicted ATPase/DNA-binding winged helix-turn-helix (wHTH) protein